MLLQYILFQMSSDRDPMICFVLLYTELDKNGEIVSVLNDCTATVDPKN